MTIEYARTKDGGFVAVDRLAKVANYAYPTSIWSNKAFRDPATVAAEMIKEAYAPCDSALADEHYTHLVAKLDDTL